MRRTCLVAVCSSLWLSSPAFALSWPQIIIAPLNGGLAGVRVADPVIQDASQDSSGVVVPLPGYKRIIADQSYDWFPAVDLGLIATWADDRHPGIGFGGHLVAFQVAGETGRRTAPALSIHFGTLKQQVFAGALFTQQGDVRLPGDVREAIVRSGQEHAYDTTRSSRHGGINFYVGVVLGGMALPK